MAPLTTVAVLGTGTMGLGMARNLTRAGLEVRAWNRSPERALPLRDEGAEVCESPGDAVAGADAVVTMLADEEAVIDVMDDGALRQAGDDLVWAQCSTLGISGTDRAAELAGHHGVAFVDAPVLGTKGPAEEGQLLVMAAGPDEAVERLGPVFDAVGRKTVTLGSVGDATRLKLVVNHWILGLVETLAQTIAFAEGVGVRPERFLEAIEGGPLNAAYAQIKGRMILDRELEASFRLALASKDAQLVLEAAEASGFDPVLLHVVAERMAEAVEAGHGDEDVAATWYASSVRFAEPSELEA